MANYESEPTQRTLKGIVQDIRAALFTANARARAAYEKLEGSDPCGESSDKREPFTMRELLGDIHTVALSTADILARTNMSLSGSEAFDTPDVCEKATASYQEAKSSRLR